MWLSETAAAKGEDNVSFCEVGLVSVGGSEPSVVTDGEQRRALLFGSAAYIPRVGDEVLVIRDSEGTAYVLGRVLKGLPEDSVRGELLLSTGGGAHIRIKPNGKIELSGEISLSGTTRIDGQLLINGMPYVPELPVSGGE